MIDMCLECPWDECINCLEARNEYGWAVRFYFWTHEKFNKDEVEKLREKVKTRTLNNGSTGRRK